MNRIVVNNLTLDKEDPGTVLPGGGSQVVQYFKFPQGTVGKYLLGAETRDGPVTVGEGNLAGWDVYRINWEATWEDRETTGVRVIHPVTKQLLRPARSGARGGGVATVLEQGHGEPGSKDNVWFVGSWSAADQMEANTAVRFYEVDKEANKQLTVAPRTQAALKIAEGLEEFRQATLEPLAAEIPGE